MSRLRSLHALGALAPLCALALAACGTPTDVGGPCDGYGAGEAPCKQQLYFPTGVIIDPDGDFLYVGSANADLRYSGGAVSTVDIKKAECVLDWARGGKAAHPAGCDSLGIDWAEEATCVARSGHSPSKGCCLNPIDLVWECDEAPFLVSTVRVGNFAGNIELQERAVGAAMSTPKVDDMCPSGTVQVGDECHWQNQRSRRLWLPVRGDPSITWIDVEKAKGGAPKLVCADPNHTNPNAPDSCEGQRINVRDFHAADPGRPDQAVPLPTEPFTVALDGCAPADADHPMGNPAGCQLLDGRSWARLAVAHLFTGEVTLINADAYQPTSLRDGATPLERVVYDVRGGFFGGADGTRRGGYHVAPRTPGDPHGLWYVSSKLSSAVGMFRVADANVILPTFGFSLAGGAFQFGDDNREFVFEPGGNRGFFLNNHPPSVYTVDTRIDPDGTPGVPRNWVVDAVDLCNSPSHLKMRRFTEPGGPGDPDRLVTRLYTVCFTGGQITVVNPDLAIVEGQLLAGRGANDVAFNFGLESDGVRGGVHAEPAHRRAYVTNYIDMTISILDLDRGSPTENRVIGRIGRSNDGGPQ